jgi:hypothetical protein
MKKYLLTPVLLFGLSLPAAAAESPLVLAALSSSATLLTQPADLERHTEKVAEIRLQEISNDINDKIDAMLLEKLQKSATVGK